MIEPFTLMRLCTLGIFGFWTVRGYWRTLRLVKKWERSGERLGIPRAVVRREVLRFVLRVTVFDPVNVGLWAIAAAIWTTLFVQLHAVPA